MRNANYYYYYYYYYYHYYHYYEFGGRLRKYMRNAKVPNAERRARQGACGEGAHICIKAYTYAYVHSFIYIIYVYFST